MVRHLHFVKRFTIIIALIVGAGTAFSYSVAAAEAPPAELPVPEVIDKEEASAPAEAIQAPEVKPVLSAEQQKKLDGDLAYKAYFGTAEEVLELISQGASTRATNQNGIPALSLAAQRKTPEGLEVIKALLASGADINIKDPNGQSPIFHAARLDNLEAVKLLLELKADYYLLDNDGNVARNIAFNKGNKEVFDAMDAFVNKQREEVLKRYEERNAKIIEQRKLEKEARLKKQAAGDEKPKALDPQIDQQALAKAIRTLSFETCAYQYWVYIDAVNLKTSLNVSALKNAIEAHKTSAEAAASEMATQFHADKKYIRRITEPSKTKLIKPLEKLGSNITRNSHGVGEIKDMETRCNKIADGWVMSKKSTNQEAKTKATK